MNDEGPAPAGASATALGAALLRAVHQLLDDAPCVHDDPVILRLLDAEAKAGIRAHAQSFQAPRAGALRTHVVVRSRFAEDRLAEAVQRGVTQYVILGAGYDTFACRQPAWAGALRIFEVDQAATQQAKLERLRQAGVVPPPNTVFVPADITSPALHPRLVEAGMDPAQPVLAACLGVLVYLDAAGVDAVFRFAAGLPRGSELVFTMSAPPTAAGDGESALAARAAAVGEPFRTHMDPDVLRERLYGLGFSQILGLDAVTMTARYLQGRRDSLRAPQRTGIWSATV